MNPPVEISLKSPVDIDVEGLARHMSEYSYGGPIAATQYMPAVTSHRIVDIPHKKIVLGFDGQTDKGFTKVTTDLAPKELALVLSSVPAQDFERLQTAFRGTNFELPKIAHSEIEAFQSERTKKLEAIRLLEEVKDLHQANIPGHVLNPGNTRNIPQNMVGYATPDSEHPILASYGAISCVIMAAYNPRTRKAALAHIEMYTKADSITDIFANLQENKSDVIEVHLAGGNDEFIDAAAELVSLIHKQPNVEIKSHLGLYSPPLAAFFFCHPAQAKRVAGSPPGCGRCRNKCGMTNTPLLAAGITFILQIF